MDPDVGTVEDTVSLRIHAEAARSPSDVPERARAELVVAPYEGLYYYRRERKVDPLG
jgi:hypothetical protein